MAMRQVITARLDAPGTGAGTNYHTLSLGAQKGDEARSQRRWLVAGVFRKLRVKLVTLPSAGSTITFTLRINTADTAMVVSFVDSDPLTKTYTASDISVAAGDLVAWKTTNNGTGGGAFTISVEFEPTTGQQSCYGGGDINGSGATPIYISCMSDGMSTVAANEMAHVITTPGTITSHGICLASAPGSTIHVFTMYKSTDNGATWVVQDGSSGTPDTRVVPNASRSAATTFSLSVAAGDLIISRYDRTSAGAINVYGQASFSFNPTTPGQFMVVGRSTANTFNLGTAYIPASSQFAYNGAAITNVSTLSGISDMTLRLFRYWLAAVPGAAKQYVCDCLLNESTTPPSGTPTITISGAASQTGLDSTNSLVCVDTDLITVRMIATSTPTATRSAWGFVSGGAPSKGGGKSKPPKGNPGFNAIESGGAAVYNIGNPGLSVT